MYALWVLLALLSRMLEAQNAYARYVRRAAVFSSIQRRAIGRPACRGRRGHRPRFVSGAVIPSIGRRASGRLGTGTSRCGSTWGKSILCTLSAVEMFYENIIAQGSCHPESRSAPPRSTFASRRHAECRASARERCAALSLGDWLFLKRPLVVFKGSAFAECGWPSRVRRRGASWRRAKKPAASQLRLDTSSAAVPAHPPRGRSLGGAASRSPRVVGAHGGRTRAETVPSNTRAETVWGGGGGRAGAAAPQHWLERPPGGGGSSGVGGAPASVPRVAWRGLRETPLPPTPLA